MNPNRTIPTITKPSKPNPYNGSLPQPKFKILSCAAPFTRLATTTTSTSNTQSQYPATLNNNITTRLPSKPSGLVRPTPVRHIISAASTTSSIKQPTQHLSSTTSSIKQPTQHHSSNTSIQRGSGSKLASPRLQSIKTAQVKKSTALNSYLPAHTANGALNILKSPILKDNSIIESVTGEVGEIRRLLEQLLNLLQNSQEQYETLTMENERLKKELTEIRKIKSKVSNARTSVIPEDSEAQQIKDNRSSVYYSPLK